MKKVHVSEAVGEVLAHDITEIKPGVKKGPAFKKGDIIEEDDIPHLLDLGKQHIYIVENGEDKLHENEGAKRLADLAQGEGLRRSRPGEGKINLTAARRGLLKVDKERLKMLNLHPDLIMATRHNNTPVSEGERVAGTRVIPLLIEEEKLERAEKEVGNEPLLSVKPYDKMEAAVITTGSEVYEGRIEDEFTDVIVDKIEDIGGEVIFTVLKPDDREQISEAIDEALSRGADLVVCTGGMSVDPDDVTEDAIFARADEVVTYGAPVLPGAMFMLAYVRDVPLVGLPACAMFSETTSFDLILPRLAAGERISAEEIAAAGHGGLCLDCEICRYPDCSFGRC